MPGRRHRTRAGATIRQVVRAPPGLRLTSRPPRIRRPCLSQRIDLQATCAPKPARAAGPSVELGVLSRLMPIANPNHRRSRVALAASELFRSGRPPAACVAWTRGSQRSSGNRPEAVVAAPRRWAWHYEAGALRANTSHSDIGLDSGRVGPCSLGEARSTAPEETFCPRFLLRNDRRGTVVGGSGVGLGLNANCREGALVYYDWPTRQRAGDAAGAISLVLGDCSGSPLRQAFATTSSQPVPPHRGRLQPPAGLPVVVCRGNGLPSRITVFTKTPPSRGLSREGVVSTGPCQFRVATVSPVSPWLGRLRGV